MNKVHHNNYCSKNISMTIFANKVYFVFNDQCEDTFDNKETLIDFV